MKIFLGLVLSLLIAAATLSSSQDTLSCGTDNLSCPRSDPDSQSLQCISASQLCDGSNLCSGGQDEGENLSTLDCTADEFVCATGESVALSALCDGTADCSNGNDETSPICENKCRSPYQGGCAELNRECTYTELDVSCDDCITGYSEVVGLCVQGLTIGTEQSFYSIREDEGSLEVCIDVLLGSIPSSDTYTISYTTSEYTAEAPEDFLDQSGTVELMSASTKQCISIPIIDDSVGEVDQECFTISLSESSGTADLTLSPAIATVCINDTDETALRVGLEQTAYTVDEVDGFQLVCIDVLSGDLDGREIILDYSTSSGTATTSDYAARSGEVTINEDDTRQCISIPIYTDSTTESLQCFSFQISLSNTVNNLTVDPDEASICIVDKNAIPITIGLTRGLYFVSESAGSVVICYEILSGRTASRSISMQFRTVQGEAEDGEDYTYTYTTDTIYDSDSSDCSTVPILSDSIDEEEECFTVSLSTTTSLSGLTIHPRIGTVCINDDDPTPVTIGLEQTTYSVYETDEYQVVCVKVLSGDIAGRNININYKTTSDTAQAADDFTALEDSFTLSDNALTQCVPIVVTSDSVDEPGEECFTFTISTATTVAGLTLSPSETEICISDSEEVVVPELTIHWQKGYYSTSETDGSVELCAELSTLQFEGNVQVNYATFGDSAKASDDFTEKSGIFTFTNSASTQCTSIVIVDDTVSESSNECFTVELSDATETLDIPSVATVCIADDDAYSVTVGMQQTAYTVTEVDEYQLVCFEVLAGDVEGREIVINYSTTSGTATTSDYSPRSGEVTITEDAQFQCVSIPIYADSSTESLQCFTFRISAGATIDGLIVEPNNAEICIVDRNSIPITIGLRQSLYYVKESASSLLVCYDVLSGRTASRSISMQMRTVQGEAKDGEDYTYTYRTDVLDDSDSTECNSVPITSDSVDEEEECFTVSLSTTTSLAGLTLSPNIATVCIIDDDPTSVTIGIQNTAYSVYETDEYLVVCAEVISGDIAGRTIDIDYITTSDTAQSPSDFTAQNDTYQLSSNALIQCVPIAITSDSVAEPGQECFMFTISTATSVAGLILSPAETEICISDSEVIVIPEPTVRLQSNYYTVGEGDGSLQICAEVTTDQFEGNFQANYMTTGGSAKAPEDFQSQTGILTFSSDVTESCVSIVIVDDNVRESGPECFTVSIVSATGDIESPSVATVCISDNDALPVTIGMQQTSYTVGEVDDYQLVCFEVLSGDIDGREIVIHYSTASATATTSDYSARSGEVTIAEDALFQCVSIPIFADSFTETTNECFTFQISAAASVDGLTVEPSEAEICIVDRNSIPITIGLRQRLYNVDEDSGPVVVCYYVLSGRTASRSISMQLRTVQGDAISGVDYTYSYTSDTLDDSDLTDCLSVSITSDNIDEEEECFTVSLSTTTSLAGLTLNPEIATICINDGDSTQVVIGLEETEYSIPETTTSQVVCANVESGSTVGRNIEIRYVVSDSADSTVQNGTILFTDGTTIQCVAVSLSSVSPNGESCLSLSLTATSTVSGLTLSPSLATLCVVSNEDIPLGIGLQQGYYSTEEDGGFVQVCVEVESGDIAGRSISVDYTTVDGSAKAPGDYTDASGTLIITEDETVQCVSVSITSDSADEQDRECFAFAISTAMEQISVETVQATICINDDDATQVTVGLQQTSYTVTEDHTLLLVCTTVESGSIAGRTITIDYQTADGDAQAPSDYSSVSGNFDMTDSNTVQCIPITIISDSTTETSDECFTYTLSATSSVAGLTLSPATATICISDEEEEEEMQTAVIIGLRQSYYSTAEGQGPVEVCVEVLAGDISGNSYIISYSTRGGLAEASSDYDEQSGSFTISETSTSECISISIVSDSVEEPEMECLIVNFTSNSADFNLKAPSVATICIRDAFTTTPVSIGLEQLQYTAPDTADYQFVCAEVRSGSIAGRDIEMRYVVSDTGDKAVQNGTLLFTDDATIQCVAVSITSVPPGSNGESCLSMSLSTTSTVSGLTISPSLATICIVPTEEGTVPLTIGMRQSYYSVKEDIGLVQVCVEIKSGDIAGRSVSLNYTTIDGSAEAPDDYTNSKDTLTFTDGTTVMCVDISIISDNEDEQDRECFAFIISTTAMEGISLETTQATICITDDDATQVMIGLRQTSYTVMENNNIVLVCTAVETGSIAGRTITIDYQTTDGGAQAPSDYLSVSGSFDMTDSNTVQCIPITIITDSTTETSDECFTYTISASSGVAGLALTPTTATICINDEEEEMSTAVTIGLQQSYYSTVEGQGPVDVCIMVLSGDITGMSYMISYSTTGGLAEATADFLEKSGSFIISEASTSKCISIPIISDSVAEPGIECFIVEFSTTSSDFILKAPSVATICIRDEITSIPVSIGLQQTQYSILDSADYQFVCAEIQSGSVAERDIEIHYTVTDTVDTTVQNGTLLFNDNTAIQCIAVSLTSVTHGSPNEESCLTLSLSVTSSGSGLTLSPSLATICVVSTEDTDTPVTIGLQQGYYSILEGSKLVQVCVQVVSGEIAGRSISIEYTTLNGSADAPGDFSDIRGTLVITEDSSNLCVNITIIDDSEDEQNRECFAFTISTTPTDNISFETSQATICITDDDATQVMIGLQQTSYTVKEDNTIVLVCTAVKSGSIAGRTITIDYQTVNGDAQAPNDYSSVGGNFDMTDSNTVQCIPITIISDNTTQTSDECFTYTISATSSVAGLTLSPTTATICISDEEEELTVHIGLEQLYYSTVEGQGSVEVCIVVLSGDITGSSFMISYTTIDGLAEAPTDYVMQNGSLTISKTHSTNCISIPIISDALEEQDMECFIASFSSVSSDFILAASVATICINEGPRAVLSLQPPLVVEGQMVQACLLLTRLDRLSQTANITLSTVSASSTATAGTDYISSSEQFTFDSSVSTKQVCLSITTLEDELVEDSETIVIAATGIYGISVSGSPVTLEVHSREFALYQFVETTYSVRENVSSLQLSVELASSSGMLLNDITLFISTLGGSATATSDYQPFVLIPLIFNAGSRAGDTQSFSVEIIDDAEVEGSEQFSLTITDSSATAQSVPQRSMATIAIIDNDFEVTVGFASLNYTVDEDVSLLEVCLKTFEAVPLSQASFLRVKTVPGSAEASTDYALLDTVVVFPVGASDGDRQCINVTILQDDMVEGTETFFLQALHVDEATSLIVIDPSLSLTTVSIADSAMVNFQIIIPNSISEDISSVDVCIEQINGELNEGVDVTIRTSQIGSTATASDYEPNTFTLTFSPGIRGPQSMCSNIQILDDILVEEDETIEVAASFEQSEPGISLIRNTASTTITDNDYILYAWENPEYKVVEDTGSLAVNLCLVSESGTLTFPVDISVTSTAISATEGEDYVRVNGTLLMESGFTAGACTPLVLSVIKDGVLESDETFQLLTDATGPAMPSSINGGTTRITIVDDDSACQQELDAFRSNTNNCTKSSSSSASVAQVGGGVVGGLIAGVLLTLVLAVIILLIIGWRCVPRKQQKTVDDGVTGLSNQTFEESSKM